MNWHWTYIERTLNMQWTRHRTLRKLKERANGWKSKEIQDLCVFSENHHQLHRFAAICSFLDCVQCVFNVAFTVCSLYVQCPASAAGALRQRPCTCVTLSCQTQPNLVLQETIHLWNHVPYTWHATYLDNPDWPDLSPSYASLWRRCMKHGRAQWVGVLDVNMACGPKTKRNAFLRRLMDKILHQHLEG